MFDMSMFERLPFRSQSEILAKKGTPLAHRHYNGWSVTLYSLNGHFIERWCGNNIEISTSFKASANPLHILEPYIDAIELDDWL